MTDCLLVTTTLQDLDTAKDIAKQLLEKKLAACINIYPAVTSLYHWDGELCESVEHLLQIKTRQTLYGQVEHLLRAKHPYILPEIIAVDISHGLPDYLEWIKESTQE